MSNTIVSTANEKAVWSTKFTTEYVRTSGFLPYMSTSVNSIIRMDKQLSGENGAVIHFPYFKKLSGAGVTGSTTLYGSEEAITNTSTAVRVSLRRNAVAVPESEKFRTDLDILNRAKPALVDWCAEKLRDDLIAAMSSIIIPGGTDASSQPLEDTSVAYGSATTGQRDAWKTSNADRVLYGSAIANGSQATHALALGQIAASQKLSAGVLNMAKTLARKTSPYKVNPYKTDATAGRDYYVLFVGPEGFRDLSVDPVIYAANKDARDRGVTDNPIFQSGDLLYNGIIIREIVEIPVVGAVGASSAQVGQAFLCGQGAVAVAYSKMPEPRTQVFDYGHINGAGIVEIRGQSKMSAGGVQTGMVTLFHAAASDA